MVNILNTSEAVPGDNERFEEIGRGCYAYSADGCVNTGVIIGDKGILVVDAQATPALAENVLKKIREISDKPVKQVVLTHYHAENTLGADVFEPGEIVASDLTRRMMDIRGKEEIRVAKERYPDLYASLPSAAGVTQPTMTIASSMTIDLGGMEVRLMHLGRAHTMGDLLVWVPESGVIFAGDLVQTSAVPFCGDAHLADWPRALDRISAFRPNALVSGRGRSAVGASAVAAAVENTRDFVTTLRDAAAACVEQGLGLKDTFLAVRDALAQRFESHLDFEFHLPFNVARAYDEALGLDQPQIWTRERCLDLIDALSGAVVAAPAEDTPEEPVAEAPQEPAPAVEEPEGEEASAETEAAEGNSDLVSDSDFAASLALEPEADLASEDEALDLTESDIVEDEDTGEEEASAEVEAEAETETEDDAKKKVLEDAR